MRVIVLLTVFCMSCRADEEVTQYAFQPLESSTDVWFDNVAGTTTTTSALPDHSSIPIQDDKLESLIRILIQEVKDVRTGIEKVEVKLTELQPAGKADCTKCIIDTFCRNATNKPIHQVYKSCQAVYDAGHKTSGVYRITPEGMEETDVYCEQELYGGGWTVFQRRMDGSENFHRGWSDYQKGFGKTSGEFWLGNDYIHALTAKHDQKLKVELQHGKYTSYANYAAFWIGNQKNNYELTATGYGGNAGDALNPLQISLGAISFSTDDKDNSPVGNQNFCGPPYQGGWWYISCRHYCINGPYNGKGGDGVNWYGFSSLSGTRMMLKPK